MIQIICRLAQAFRSGETEGTKANPLHKIDYEAFLKHVEAGEHAMQRKIEASAALTVSEKHEAGYLQSLRCFS